MLVVFLLVLIILLVRTEAYAVYGPYDEFANSKLPGNLDDIRGMANLPFNVDGNRESDGVSSRTPLTTTSPSFPLYTSSKNYENFGITTASELQLRKDAAELLHIHRREQGMAGPTAGEAEREAAAYQRLIEIGDSSLGLWLPTGNFLVDSAKRWNPSSFPIQRYEQYRIEVLGDQRYCSIVVSKSEIDLFISLSDDT